MAQLPNTLSDMGNRAIQYGADSISY